MNLNELIKTTISETVTNTLQGDTVWEEFPVSPTVFFSDWLKPALSIPQLDVLDNLFKGKEWSKDYIEYLLYWGEGCIVGDTILKDETTGKDYQIEYLAKEKKSIVIKSVKIENGHYKFVNKKTGVPYKKGKTELYEVITKSGKKITVSAEHKFYTNNGWKKLKDLNEGDKIAVNSTTSTNKDTEKQRRENISKTMLGMKKSKEHAKHIKEAKNSGRFKKDSEPWNKNKTGVYSKKTIELIRESSRIAALNLSSKQREKQKKAQRRMKNHKKNCNCPWCRTMRDGAHTIWYTQKYKNITMRSSWEVKYAKYLDENNIKWKYECKIFNLDNYGRYTPDFYLSELNEYVEIKGRYTQEAKNKIEYFKTKYKNIKFKMLFKKDLIELGVLC